MNRNISMPRIACARFDLSEYYSLSRRTGLHALQAFQRTNGNTPGTAGSGHIITATATIGEAAGVGIVHRF